MAPPECTPQPQPPLSFTSETPESIRCTYLVTYDGAHGLSVYRPVQRPLPAYRMPPPAEQPPAALPGAAPPHTLRNTYPIEREVIVSCVNKNTKIPLLNERRLTGKVGVAAVAPDIPPKHLAAWTHLSMENQHIPQAGPSNDVTYRIPSHEQVYATYMQNQSTLNQRNYKEMLAPKPPVPVKHFIAYGPREQNVDNTITSIEPDEEAVKETPKLKSKTYTTLKDMLSRFKSRDNNDSERNNDASETNLNNVYERTPEEARALQNGQRQICGREGQQTRQQEPQYMVPNGYQRSQMQMIQHQQMVNQQMMRSQQHIMSADSLYQAQGFSRARSAYEGQQISYPPQQQHLSQIECSRTSKSDLRSQQQIEREMVIARSFTESRRTASQPHLLDEFHSKHEQPYNNQDKTRRNSHGNIVEAVIGQEKTRLSSEEKESDDGGFRDRLQYQDRASFEKGRIKSKQTSRPNSRSSGKNDDRASQTSNEVGASKINNSYNSLSVNPSRLTPSKIEDMKGKKSSGSAASSDYDKSGGNVSSNVDSGRGSVAYSSGRRPTADHDTATDSRDTEKPTTSKTNSQGEPEWVDIVESELRQILEPNFNAMKITDQSDGGKVSNCSASSSSVTPPLPPLSPNASDSTPCRERRYKHQSLPLNSRPEYEHKSVRSPPHTKQKHSKREHSSHYKKQLFGLDTTDLTSTTTRSLDLSSLLGGNSDSDVSAQDARAIRRQLQGLENMYCEVLKLLGVRKPINQVTEPRMATSKRRYGSMSSLPSSSVSSRPIRDKRRVTSEHRKKNDIKSIKKRFERLESHVVTLARSVAHLSGEMRAQHTLLRELDAIRAELAALRAMHRAQYNARRGGEKYITDPKSFSNPERVKRLTKFFGDEPPLMRQFLKKLGYEKYAALLEAEKVGAAELPYVGEERLRSLGVPLGPRLRILKEAGAHLESIPESGITNTTLAIV